MLKRHEVLFTQLNEYRQELLHIVSTLTEQEMDIVPKGFNNNIRWNLGHVFLDQFLWIQHLTKEPIDLIPVGYKEWFGYGTSPSTWTSNPPSIGTLRHLLADQPKQIFERYGDRLEEEFPVTESGMHTIAQVLVRTIFHEGIHLASINHIRKFLNT